MKTAIRVPLCYLTLAVGWLILTDRLFADPAAVIHHMPMIGKGLLFAVLSSIVLHFLLLQEEQRRDALEQTLRFQAIHDPLTGLLNRACFAETLDRSIAKAARDASTVGVAFVDMNGFKQVNDLYGHHIGDQLLVEVAARVRTVIRSADCAARFGGDEFVVLCPGEREEGALRLVERLQSAINAPIVIDGKTMAVSASIGLAMYPEDGDHGEILLRAADQAMYRAKALARVPARLTLRPGLAAAGGRAVSAH